MTVSLSPKVWVLSFAELPPSDAWREGDRSFKTKRVSRIEEGLFGVFARHVYPQPYTFDVNAVRIFSDGVRLGGISNCQPLDEIEFDRFLNTSLEQIRDQVGLETDLLAAYYTIEKQRYPDAPASQFGFTAVFTNRVQRGLERIHIAEVAKSGGRTTPAPGGI